MGGVLVTLFTVFDNISNVEMHCGPFFTEAVFLPALTSTTSVDVLNEVRGSVTVTGMDSGTGVLVAVVDNLIISRRF